MPISVTFREPRTFLATASGRITAAECRSALAEIQASLGSRGEVKLIADARTVTGAPSTSELRDIAVALKPLYEHGVQGLAIVTDENFVYGVARMFSAFAEAGGMKVSVFRDFAEAARWLDDVA